MGRSGRAEGAGSRSGRVRGRGALLAGALALAACGGEGEGPPVRVHIPEGSSFSAVADSLAAHDIVDAPFFFRLYARAKGATADVKPGTYAFRRGTGWDAVLSDLRAGRTLTVRLTIPEGWDTERIAQRIARLAGADQDSIFRMLRDTAADERWGVPGPTLEGYLYPATYTFPATVSADSIIARLVREYEEVWTPERRALADSLGMDEREVVTLASIIEKEAKIADEMPTISSVYHNRLRIGYPLQADPTVQYALGDHQSRLLYAHIDEVADHPYNTYTHAGLPPGPIGSPSSRAIEAALRPAETDFLYFVAQPDGRHVFTRSLEEHNRAKVRIRRMLRESERAADGQ